MTKKIKVYLVEDQDLIRESLSTMLSLESDIEVVGVAADAETALEELEVMSPDVVLMDIRLPGMDGIEATTRIGEIDGNASVLILTSFGDEYIEAALDAGASGYILKSCNREQLVSAVKATHQGQLPIDPSVTTRLVRELSELRKGNSGSQLTPRQLEVLKLVSEGNRYKRIAENLYVSERTVHREMQAIFDRLGVSDAAHAVSEAYRHKIIVGVCPRARG